jgi:tetratricopeptide (TPR) repeat protein
MHALFATHVYVYSGNYAAAHASLDELIGLADERDAPFWKALGTAVCGWLFTVTGKASDAVRTITSGITSLRSTGATLYEPMHLQYLATAYSELGELDDARRCIDDAIETMERSKERWCEAEVNRIAGEIALKSPAPDPEKAEAYFDRALTVARQQQAKSWELRAAMSMALLWRDQGQRDEARELLAPVFGWFTEGFDTPYICDVARLAPWSGFGASAVVPSLPSGPYSFPRYKSCYSSRSVRRRANDPRAVECALGTALIGGRNESRRLSRLRCC